MHFKQSFLHGAPLGSQGSANQSGWMIESDFVLFLKHFIHHVQPSTERDRVAGISPFNRFIFNDEADFAPSFVTDRPQPTSTQNEGSVLQEEPSSSNNISNTTSKSLTTNVEDNCPLDVNIIDLFNVDVDVIV